MRGSVQSSIMLTVCLACLFIVAHARPSSKEDNEAEKLQRVQENLEWESQWWTPKEKGGKDSWKVFDTQKPAENERWWEEDWHEDEWWSPKDSSSSVSSSSGSSSSKTTRPSSAKKTTDSSVKKASHPVVKKKKGEDQSDVANKVDSPATVAPKDSPRQQDAQEQPQALPLVGASEEDKSGFFLKENSAVSKSHEEEQDKQEDVPVAETPREKVSPGLKGDIMISPFEDPKPGPYSGARDEAPSVQQWEYHQLTGFGKYIDQGKDKDSDNMEAQTPKPSEVKQVKNESKDVEKEEYMKKKVEHLQEEIQEKEEDRVVKIPEENKYKVVDQFYGFGLESGAGASPSITTTTSSSAAAADKAGQPVKATEAPEAPQLADSEEEEEEKQTKENYNKGIIYDVVPGSPELTHSVKKDLVHSGNYALGDQIPPVKKAQSHSSVKKDLSKEYSDEDIASTKTNLQTSPNPPPPGLAEEKKNPETTSTAPHKASGKSNSAQIYIKSHPLSTDVVQ